MITKSLKFRIESSLVQRFRSVVTTSQLHCALMKISEGTFTFPAQAVGKKVSVYVVVFNASRDPQASNKAYAAIAQNFNTIKIDQDHFYLS
ncbi:hypothetical protein ACX1H8_20405 [Yersinia enterocolitica]|uniref:hypothetical protein n=1 Tax=Yersinia enterocolitica TaxID=630 RepID=UPI0005E4DEED|nr:hypothetical protein [Yersinia enterocolitica]EKN4766936.1 hypothetical protein [Yersinia enterocolitica]EKN5953788.1 hypothetical protein [Yersinia enterocolitica]ELI8116593.1 hypothetical protein [Yersinia enterocolitica]ELI8291967.1 hypothetical protein [Yersinia enterocolitica]ELW7404231.1 hypothetical protein [Yersinia enterocolitica]